MNFIDDPLCFLSLVSSHKFFASCNTVLRQTSRNHHFNRLSVASMKTNSHREYLSIFVLCNKVCCFVDLWGSAKENRFHPQLVLSEYHHEWSLHSFEVFISFWFDHSSNTGLWDIELFGDSTRKYVDYWFYSIVNSMYFLKSSYLP